MTAIAIISILLSVIGIAAGAAMNADINQQNISNASQINESQQTFAHEEAELSNERAIQNYWGIQSPAAMVQQYKDAGLSVGMMYNKGGSGAIGHAAQAAQPSAALPYLNPLLNTDSSNFGDILGQAQQAEKTKEETNKINEEVNEIKSKIEVNNETIKKIASDIGLNEISQKNISLQTKLLENQNEFEVATMEDRIDITHESLHNLRKSTESIIEDINGKKLDNASKKEMTEAIINNLNANTGLIEKQQILTMTQTVTEKLKQILTDATIEKTKSETEQIKTLIGKIGAETEKIKSDTELQSYTLREYRDGNYYLVNEKGYGKIMGLIGDASRKIADGIESAGKDFKGFKGGLKAGTGGIGKINQ